MGYSGNVNLLTGETSYLDLKIDLEQTIGKEVMLGFTPNIPEYEKYYILEKVKVTHDSQGAKIDFTLKDKPSGAIINFVIRAIKNFQYDVHDHGSKYWVSTSNVELNEPSEDGSVKLQYGTDTYRFWLFK